MFKKVKNKTEENSNIKEEIEKIEKRIKHCEYAIKAIIEAGHVIPNGKKVEEEGKHLTPDGDGIYRNEEEKIVIGKYMQTEGVYKVKRKELEDFEQYKAILEYRLTRLKKLEAKNRERVDD